MKIYLVGGAVRDQLLDLPVRDRDWVVVGGSGEQLLARGLQAADAEFPVFIDPASGEEYALARREIKTGPGYKGFHIEAGPEVTLEEDLVRRDLTINALARDESGRLIDLFGGREDLDQGLLRHISPAFVEDPVRLLRTARFAARLGRWGFRVAHTTQGLLGQMAASGELRFLRPERVWREMKQALAEDQPWRFFEVLQRSGALAQLIPELDRVLSPVTAGHGVPAGDPFSALRRAVARGADPVVRFAVVMYPAARATADATAFIERLRAERDYRELLLQLLRLAESYRCTFDGDPEMILQLIERTRALQQPERFKFFLSACEALWPAPSGHGDRLTRALARVERVDAAMLLQEGLAGESLGEELRRRRLAQIVVEEAR